MDWSEKRLERGGRRWVEGGRVNGLSEGVGGDNPLKCTKVIEALGSDPHPNPLHFPFHAEAWVTPEDDIVLCEIASRGGLDVHF